MHSSKADGHMVRRWLTGTALALSALLLGCSQPGDGPLPASDVDGEVIGFVDQRAEVWLSNGRSYAEQRYSPLAQIDRTNVTRLGLAWEADLESPRFGIEATPIVVDGVLYVSSSWSRVFAFDAATGERLWAYDPQVSRDWLRYGCCKPVNRGVALWRGKVYVAAFDGRLIALDVSTGREVWSVDTTDGQPYYTITGAPRVVDGKVLIGNGGADFGVRGFFTAYDAETGALVWRFYTVPGDPAEGFEHPELALAATTWDAGRDWSIGGGGTVWDSYAYDPELELLYVGTGNGGPWDSRQRNPGGGDQLFLSSILAIEADSGRLAWHYQTTPGDSWDFTATQHMVLADLTIGGTVRKVLMQAPKNGFFYVLDRVTGELLSADDYVRVNWASHIDPDSGRPVFTEHADYRQGPTLIFPSPYGGHNWQPMAYSPDTGLTYVPARDIGWIWGAPTVTWFEQGYPLEALDDAELEVRTRGLLIAWDPVAREPAWTVPQQGLTHGGVLATAGGLVVQGSEDGSIHFYGAEDGEVLSEIFIGTGIVAPPISYAVGGVQHIAVAAGWNGVKPAPPAADAPPPYDNAARLIVLRLDGESVAVAPRTDPAPWYPGDEPQPPALVAQGDALYQAHCAMCHGVVGERSVFPDLRRMSQGSYQAFDAIVRGGALRGAGMASFADVLDAEQVVAIRAYVVDWAQRTRRQARSGADRTGGATR
jgi:quinohemoprotein ethanol dehydrogenase